MKSAFTFICSTVLVIGTLYTLSTTVEARQFSGGTGTFGDPYQVGSASELNEIRNNLTSHFVLIANIDLDVSPYNTGSGWEPIPSFTGSFQGNGLKISSLFINRSGASNVGLFSELGSGGSIDSLTLDNIDVLGNQYVGGLVGQNTGGTISFTHITGRVSGGLSTGGLAGRNYSGGIIEYSSTMVYVSATNQEVGGITGRNNASTIRYTFATDTVTSTSSSVGGIAGKNTSSAIVSNSYATGYTSGTSNIGGLVGRNNNSTIINSYSTGTSTGGGLVGNNTSTVTDSFWDIETSGNGGSAAGTGKTTSEMQQQATFTNWDFSTIWGIDEGDSHPYLLDNLPESIGDSPFQSGSGTMEDPYLVANATQLDSIRNYNTSHFKLNANIDLDISPYNTGEGWEPIGGTSAAFGGSLDGAGFVIYDLMIDRPTEDSIGLFRVINNGSLSNLGIINASVEGDSHVGILMGNNNSGSITNSYATGSVIANGSYAGGLVGINTGTIDTTYASVFVTGLITGGLVASNSGTVTESYWNRKNSTDESGIASGTSTTGTTGLDNNLMKRQANFNSEMFSRTWSISEKSSYPYLSSNTPPILPGVNDYSYNSGNGTKVEPFLISTLSQLDSLRAFLSSSDVYYELTTGFDLGVSPYNTGEGWEPIGSSDNPFLGNIIGGGNKLSGLMINRPSDDEIGFFGVLKGKIDSLWFDSVSVTGNNKVGSLSGVIADTTRYVFTTGTIIANGDSVGGITGVNNGLITASYTLANVSGTSVVGGLAGYNSGTIDTSYAVGDVTGSGNNIGGLVGASSGGVATTSYWNKGTTSQVLSSGGNGLSTAGMKQATNFQNWNFTTTWSISEGSSYPYLSVYTTSPLPGTGVFLGGGAGTSGDPYIITNSEQLSGMSDSLSSYFRLGKNIDLSSIPNWSPIGENSNLLAFRGGLHGGGYTITGLTINSSNEYIGLFGVLREATIDSVWLTDVQVNGSNFVGALVGAVQKVGTDGITNISNSYSTGSVSGGNYIGGLIGRNFEGNISNSYSESDVSSTGSPTGGFIGEGERGSIQYSYATGDVTSTSTNNSASTGGFAGKNAHRGDINYSFATGDVTSSGGAEEDGSGFDTGGTGGFIGATGEPNQPNSNNITNSYATGNVTSTASNPNVGGFAGSKEDGTVTNSFSTGLVNASGIYANGFIGRVNAGTASDNYWNTETSGKSLGGTGTGLNNAQMKQETNFSNWDFVTTWSINERASFPYLQNVSNSHVPTVFEVSGDEGWRIFSAGFEGLSYAELLEDIWTQGFTGSDGGGDISNVYVWNGASYVPINNGFAIPEPGTGFIAYVYSDDENDGIDEGFPKYLPQQGSPTSGTISPTLYNLDSGSTNATDSVGWNLIGNPFMSAIDWDASGWTSSNIDNVLYVWSDSAGGAGSYLTWNGVSGTKGSGIIAPGQGFWVKANAGSPSLSINESVKKDTSSVLLKKTTVPQLTLTIKGGTYSGRAIIMFNENSSTGKDPLDAYSLYSLSNEWISVSTENSNGEALSINALPVDLGEKIIIPINILGMGVPSRATLSFSGLENFEGWGIEIVDTETGNRVNVFNSGGIELDVEELKAKDGARNPLPLPFKEKAKQGTARYQLHLVPGTSVSLEDFESDLPSKVELMQNYPNPFNPVTTIKFGVPVQGKVRLEVFDVLGRKVAELLNEPMQAGRYSVNFDASNLSNGMYIYRLQMRNISLTKKMMLIK